MNILLLEPFLSGSHQKWAEGYQAFSRHEVRLLSLKGRHWKWRMHGGAVSLAGQLSGLDWKPNLLLATDMLDVAAFLGLTRQHTAGIPAITYFHENQITYPWSPADEDVAWQRDNHYGFINYTSALASERIFFNSHFHRRSFLDSLPDFLKQFPDARELHRIEEVKKKSEVLPLGMNLRALGLHEKPKKYPEATLLWNHRWEYDKAPEAFFEALFRLKEEGIAFRLIVLGASYQQSPEIFEIARHRLQQEIVHFGYAESQAEYARLLWQADLLPVTSRQDFFGGSVVEAIYCNCFPLLPNRLAYPEHIPAQEHPRHLYEKEEEFYPKLKEAILGIEAIRQRAAYSNFVAKYDWSILAAEYDRAFEQLAGQTHSKGYFMKFITYQDKKIAYKTEGKGAAVVLLHGFCEDSSIWEDFQADLLEENYRVIRIDLPGFGKSEVMPDVSIEQMAEAVHAVLLKLNQDKVVFIGHSMGGYVGLAFARLYPELLAGLGLFHSHPYADSEDKKENRRKSVAFIQRQGHALFVKQLIPTLFNRKFANSNAFLVEKLTYRAARGKSAGIMAAQEAMIGRQDETSTLSGLVVPALFIIGEEDQAVPPESIEQIHLPQTASIHILENVGHMGLFEARKKTQHIVRQFVEFCKENNRA